MSAPSPSRPLVLLASLKLTAVWRDLGRSKWGFILVSGGVLMWARLMASKQPVTVLQGAVDLLAAMGLPCVALSPLAGLFGMPVTLAYVGTRRQVLAAPLTHRRLALQALTGMAAACVAVVAMLMLLMWPKDLRAWTGWAVLALEAVAGCLLAASVDVGLLASGRVRFRLMLAAVAAAVVTGAIVVTREPVPLADMFEMAATTLLASHRGALVSTLLLLAASCAIGLRLSPIDLREPWKEPRMPPDGVRSARRPMPRMPWLGGIGPFIARWLVVERTGWFGLPLIPLLVAAGLVLRRFAPAEVGWLILFFLVVPASCAGAVQLKVEMSAKLLRFYSALPLPPRRLAIALVAPALAADLLRLALTGAGALAIVAPAFRAHVAVGLASVAALPPLLSSMQILLRAGRGLAVATLLLLAAAIAGALALDAMPFLDPRFLLRTLALVSWPTAIAMFLLAARALGDRSRA